MSNGRSSDHWKFYSLPPFFTKQIAPVTLARQATLWGDLIIDHAAYHAQQQSRCDKGVAAASGSCAQLRFYSSSSDIFLNATIGQRLSPAEACTMLDTLVEEHPNQAVLVDIDHGVDTSTGSRRKSSGVLIATVVGGLPKLEEALLSWILDIGSGSTMAVLAKKGVVLTFNELASARCFGYVPNGKASGGSDSSTIGTHDIVPRLSNDPVSVSDVGAVTEEMAIRLFLRALNNRPTSVLRPLKITLFNMDGSTREPFEGVKIGGE